MTRNIIFLLGLSAVVLIILTIMTFTLGQNGSQDQETTNETEQASNASSTARSAVFTVRTYGGPSNVKTVLDGGVPYATTRNPRVVGGLEFAASDINGEYYFAEDENGEKIAFELGQATASFGYTDVAAMTGEPLRNLPTKTQYYVAYPDQLSAQTAGITVLPDNSASNELLSNQLLRIKNLNNNVMVIAVINHRSESQGLLLMSELVRDSLQLEERASARLELELIPANTASVGVIPPGRQ